MFWLLHMHLRHLFFSHADLASDRPSNNSLVFFFLFSAWTHTHPHTLYVVVKSRILLPHSAMFEISLVCLASFGLFSLILVFASSLALLLFRVYTGVC
jgi:hypothetical protein